MNSSGEPSAEPSLANASAEAGHGVATRFSIFIPIWNDAEWLPGAIDSVSAQTHQDWELIIGDNVSTDGVEDVVAPYSDPRIRYHRWADHVDYASNANRTIGLCRYEWLQYLSADDRLLPTCLERMTERVEEAKGAGQPLSMVLTGCARFDESGRRAEHVYYGTWRLKLLESGIMEPADFLRSVAAPGAPPWNIGSLAISAQVYQLMGGYFRQEIGLTADVEMATRAAAYGPVGYVADPLLHYTVRADSITHDLSKANLQRPGLLPPVAAALVSALAVHEYRREVSPSERRFLRHQVADQLVGRALQQRYRPGGQGRVGAIRDILRAAFIDPRWLISPRHVARAMAAIVAPSAVISRTKRYVMARGRYL